MKKFYDFLIRIPNGWIYLAILIFTVIFWGLIFYFLK